MGTAKYYSNRRVVKIDEPGNVSAEQTSIFNECYEILTENNEQERALSMCKRMLVNHQWYEEKFRTHGIGGSS